MTTAPPYCVGLDVGYGALKFVHGAVGERTIPAERTMPVGAAPIESVERLNLEMDASDRGQTVLVNGKRWIAGISPLAIEGGKERQLNASYSTTDEYAALYRAALSIIGQTEIDVLVTGLPTNQALDRERAGELVALLHGRQVVRHDLVVNVKKVVVLPQPAGAYKDLCAREPDVARRDDQFVLCVDPGYFSTDWLLMRGRKPRPESSFSSQQAWSRVLELTQARLAVEYPRQTVSIDRIDESVRRHTTSSFPMGKIGDIDLSLYLRAAASEVAQAVLPTLLRKMRLMTDTPSIVLLAGGAAEYFRPELEKAFSESTFFVAPKPQLANARGFFRFAAEMAAPIALEKAS